MIRPGAARLLAALAATGAPAVPGFSVAAAQAVAEPDGRSLGAAVEEVRRSPFHARDAAPSTVALGTQAWPGYPIAAVGRSATLAGAPADDTTAAPAKLSQVFLASWGAAAVSYPPALLAAYHIAFADEFPELLFWGVVTALVAIPASGARLAGAPYGYGTAIPGSLLGLGAGIGAGAVVAGTGMVDVTIAGPVALFAASSLAHAGVITLFTWLWLAAEHGDR